VLLTVRVIKWQRNGRIRETWLSTLKLNSGAVMHKKIGFKF
jgi:hypothetical protein